MNLSNRILLVNDNEETSRYLMEHLLIDGGYSVSIETTFAAAVENYKSSQFDLVILKLGLTDLDCAAMVKELKTIDPDSLVIALIDENKPEALERLNGTGITDFICKPFNTAALSFLVRKNMDLRLSLLAQRRLISILKEQNTGLQKQNLLLSKRIEESTRNLARLYEDLRSTYLRTIRALAQAIDMRDHYTHSHSENVSRYAVAIGRELGYTVKDLELLRDAAELHDIGKIGISDIILLKPAALTAEEWEVIKKHPQIGAQILEPLTFLSDVIEQVRQHHEHFDGSGYPLGKKGDDILLGARILHVADA